MGVRRKTSTLLLSALSTLGLVAALAVVEAAPANAAGRSVALILDYRVVWWCPVYTNYPKADVSLEQAWWIVPGDIVAWRYNVNSDWALISDKKYRGSPSHAWWGFTPRVCIGGSVGGEPFPTADSSYPAGVPIPSVILEGRSNLEPDHYRTVNFTLPAAGVDVDPYKEVQTEGTLRDGPNNFVIGNVFAGWHVHQTNIRYAGWTYVYVFNAQRWGWVEDFHL